jgi:hypothetical protein
VSDGITPVAQRQATDKEPAAKREVQRSEEKEPAAKREVQKMEEKEPAAKREVQKMEEKEPAAKREVQMMEENEPAAKREVQMMEEKEPAAKREVQKAEEKEPQAKGDSNADTATMDVSSAIDRDRGAGRKMDESTLAFMEQRFGADFEDVKIHDDPEAARISKELGAQAFAIGEDVFFNTGKYNPDTNEGKRLLAHELTHTIQQSGKKGKKNVGAKKGNKAESKVTESAPKAKETTQAKLVQKSDDGDSKKKETKAPVGDGFPEFLSDAIPKGSIIKEVENVTIHGASGTALLIDNGAVEVWEPGGTQSATFLPVSMVASLEKMGDVP